VTTVRWDLRYHVLMKSRFACALAVLVLGCSSSSSSGEEAEVGGDDDTGAELADTSAGEDTEVADSSPVDTGTVVDTGSKKDTAPPACLAVGSGSDCSGKSCCDEGECVSSSGGPYRCCWTDLQPEKHCTAGAQCCGGSCTGGKCCRDIGEKCSLSGQCCVKYCGNRVTATGAVENSVCCGGEGQSCSTADDICSHVCTGGTCASTPSGGACGVGVSNHCCSGSCLSSDGGHYCK
jgi:hypothetical protein